MLTRDIGIWYPIDLMSEFADYLTVTETAKRYNVTDRTIRRWIEVGEFPNAYQLIRGSTSPYRIPLGDIEAFDKRREGAK